MQAGLMNHLSGQPRRMSEIFGTLPEMDIPGASVRIFRNGDANTFLSSPEKNQLSMLRNGDNLEVANGVRECLESLLVSLAMYQRQKDLDVRPHQIRNETMTSEEITPEIVTEVSDYYRWLFGNTMHYATCPSCENRNVDTRLTARQTFGTGEELVPLNQIDNAEGIMSCVCCHNPMQIIYDRETVADNFDQKLRQSDESFLSLLRREDNSLAGLAFAYVTQLDRELDLEWSSKYPYMRNGPQQPEYQRSRESFLNCVGEMFPGNTFDGNETVLAWNCISTSPDIKAGKTILLVRSLFDAIPEEMRHLMVLGDVKKGSQAHRFFRALKGNDGDTFFERDDEILIGGNVGVVNNVLNARHKRSRERGSPRASVPEEQNQLSHAQSNGGEPEDWDEFAGDYDSDVYSITKPPEKRKRIIESIKDGEKIFITGCGSETYLQEDLLSQKKVDVTAGDFSQRMLDISSEKFQHQDLRHITCDTRDLPFEREFDTVISTNSIIPPNRSDVVAMYRSLRGALKTDGQLIAYLPSFTLCQEMLDRHPELREIYEGRMDYKQCRFQDTVGQQCWHTEELIYKELEEAGFAKKGISVEKVGCESDEEAAELGRIYELDPDLIGKEFSCFFVTAKK
jgi:hypothetical protein